MQTATRLLPTSPEKRAAEARYQEDLAIAEEQYARALRSIGESTTAEDHEARARSHREKATRIRRGGA